MGMPMLSIDFGTHLGDGAGGDKTLMLFIENNNTKMSDRISLNVQFKKESKYDRNNPHKNM